ncbi:MAG: phage tail protein I [Clostridia bacterium]|jgi:phage tail P2-like protein|nr:phage tail protein I [Clostridia bacterium]
MNNIYDIDYLSMLPDSLLGDTNMVAFAKAFNEQMQKILKLVKKDIIYFYIDTLPDKVLDVLAQDLKVDWYNLTYDTDTKRKIIKNAVKVHKYKGTPYAVKTAVSDVLPGTTIQEWPEYSGNPYKFKINLEAGKTGFDSDKVKQILRQVELYKNERSHLDAVNANITGSAGAYNTAMPSIGAEFTIEPYTIGDYTAKAAAGSAAGVVLPVYMTIQEV